MRIDWRNKTVTLEDDDPFVEVVLPDRTSVIVRRDGSTVKGPK